MAPLRGSIFCFNHDPERPADEGEGRPQGGQATRTKFGDPVPLRDVRAIRRELEAVVGDAKMQPNSPDRSRTILSALRLALEVLAADEWEDRLTALESGLGAYQATLGIPAPRLQGRSFTRR